MTEANKKYRFETLQLHVGLLLADVQLQGFKTVLLVVLGHGILLGCARSRGFFLATRLPCSGGWRGVGYEVTTLGPRGAS